MAHRAVNNREQQSTRGLCLVPERCVWEGDFWLDTSPEDDVGGNRMFLLTSPFYFLLPSRSLSTQQTQWEGFHSPLLSSHQPSASDMARQRRGCCLCWELHSHRTASKRQQQHAKTRAIRGFVYVVYLLLPCVVLLVHSHQAQC